MNKDKIKGDGLVEKERFNFDSYVDIPRWNSYYYQIKSVCNCKGNNVLIIGDGDGIVDDILKKAGKRVTTFDLLEELKPDIVGDVTKIDKIIKEKYDIVVCCQVLEHIPFEKFEPTIEKISKITNNLVLSLPNKNIRIKYRSYCPIIGYIMWKFPVRIFWQNIRDINKDGYGEHYREIDAKSEWKAKKIKKILMRFFMIEDCFTDFCNTYHMFFILKKTESIYLSDA